MPDDNEQFSSGEDATAAFPAAKIILIVEDDTDIGAFLVQALSQETCYQALLATDGFQALKIVNDIKPNLFLLDYHLPRMNGIELYDQLHAQKELEDVPAIMTSASLPQRAIGKRQIINLDKPVELDGLLQVIQEVLGQDSPLSPQ